MSTTRKEVYEAIDSEREYQDSFVADKFTKTTHPIAAEILMMEEYIEIARSNWTHNKGDEVALESIRKVAALAVRCMENHGAPFRRTW